MIVRLEALEKKLKGLQALVGATDEQVAEAHDDSVAEAAAAEAAAAEDALELTQAGKDAVAARIAARKKK